MTFSQCDGVVEIMTITESCVPDADGAWFLYTCISQ